MEHFAFSLDDYQRALAAATGSYKSHLENDFVITMDGNVLPRVDFTKLANRNAPDSYKE